MYSVRLGFVARQYDPSRPPNIVEYLGLEPIKWSESYDLYGERYEWAKDAKYDPSDRTLYSKFKAKCKICGEFTKVSYGSEDAIFAHFKHCSKNHGYIFEESDNYEFKASDSKLQELIILAMEYDLPLPGYEDHSKCIMQYRNNKAICVLHDGNEYGSKSWMEQ